MSLISIITQTLKSQYPLPAERSNLRELPPHPPPALNAGSVTRGEWWFHAGREKERERRENERKTEGERGRVVSIRKGREREK